MSYAFQPSVADIRAIRSFKMDDTALTTYITLAETSPYNFLTSTAVPSDAARRQLWALMAAHLATVMREPEPISVSIGPMRTDWQGVQGTSAAFNDQAMASSAPGREFLSRWRRYNRGRVLR